MSPSAHHKRRRCAPTTAAASTSASSDASSSWASLPGDLVDQIGWRVLGTGDLLDYVGLRAVCGGWRSATVSPRGRGLLDPRFRPRRWMMLPEGHGLHPGHSKLRGYIRFFNLSTGAIVRVRLPIFSDHCVLDSVDGVLLLERDQDTAVRLLHPFTGDIAELPPLATLKTELKRQFSWRIVRTVGATAFDAVGAEGVVTVMIALDQLGRVAYATTIDQQWKLSTWTSTNHFWRPISFQHKIYLLDSPTCSSDLKILEMDLPQRDDMTTGSGLPEPKLIATCPADKLHWPYNLAECDSEILLIGRNKLFSSDSLVYRLADIIIDRFVPVTSIGANTLFAEERVLSVSSSVHPTIVADSVVLVHRKDGYLGQYHLGTRTWEHTADGCVEDNGGVPSPCSLIYHIFTCCHRATWNKGALLFQGERQPNWMVKRNWRDGA